MVRTLLAAFILVGCASSPFGPARTFTPQQVNSDPERFHDRVVRIRGYVTIGVELRTIYQSKALLRERKRLWEKGEFLAQPWDNYCLTLINALDRDVNLLAYNRRMVEVLARVDKDYGDRTIDLGACRVSTGIVVLRVASVEN